MLYINCLFNQSFVKFEVTCFYLFLQDIFMSEFHKIKMLIKYYTVLVDHFNTRVIVCCMTPDDVIRSA